MGTLISSINITADGFCGHLDAIADEEHHLFAIDILRQADLLLLGRQTYQIFEDFWPIAAKDKTLAKPIFEFAQLLDNTKKIVATTTLQKAEWKNTSILYLANSSTISDLKSNHKNILVFGSPGLLSSLTQQGLINEYYFTIQPIISGKGVRIFDKLSLESRLDLKLVKTMQFVSGVVTLHYSINENQGKAIEATKNNSD
jgi:dihydrofolate reductase